MSLLLGFFAKRPRVTPTTSRSGPSISGNESEAICAREEPGEVRVVLPGDSPQASCSSLTSCPPVELPDEFERLSQGKFIFSFAPAVCHLSPHALMQRVPLQASNDACGRSPVPSFVSGSFGRSGGQGTLRPDGCFASCHCAFCFAKQQKTCPRYVERSSIETIDKDA